MVNLVIDKISQNLEMKDITEWLKQDIKRHPTGIEFDRTLMIVSTRGINSAPNRDKLAY